MTTDDWSVRLGPDRITRHLSAVLSGGLLADTPAILLHDVQLMRKKLDALKRAFPADALHAIAVKANPVVGLLQTIVQAGHGLECASWEEVVTSLRAGCPAESVVYDSPAKTVTELRHSLETGLVLNADNFSELARIDRLIRDGTTVHPRTRIGLRLNPMVGTGAIATTSVGGRVSKFGVPLYEAQAEVLEAFRELPWLTGIHSHVGSQGCTLEQLAAAAERIERLVEEVQHQRPDPLAFVDIGGGLPVRYEENQTVPTISDYADALHDTCPALMTGPAQLVTEFGRSVHANCGLAFSRVEYVKRYGKTPTAVIHLGADFLLRPVYHPADWRHEFLVFDSGGTLKTGPPESWSIAGPLCFGGDFIGRGVTLPPIEEGDILCIRDVGAYTLSMWSRHCSRGQPPVYSVDEVGTPVLVRAGESAQDVASHWADPRRT